MALLGSLTAYFIMLFLIPRLIIGFKRPTKNSALAGIAVSGVLLAGGLYSPSPTSWLAVPFFLLLALSGIRVIQRQAS